MFYDVVSNLSLSPAASSQLAFYWRRLKREQMTRQLSLVMAAALVLVQFATILAPPDPASASSSNDLVRGGIDTGHPQATILSIYDQDGSIRSLFNHYGIDRSDLAHTTHGTINSSNHDLKSIGRNHNFAQDETVNIGNSTYYLRPLYLWADSHSYAALVGHRHGDDAPFAVMYACGNLVLTNTHKPTVVQVQPTAQPKPLPKVAVSGTPKLMQHKSGIIISRDGSRRDANGATAQAGDIIEYTLTTENTGTVAQKNFAVSDNVSDTLEYANILNPGGAILLNGALTWPATSIAPGKSFITTFQVQVKDPIPANPVSISNPRSYDLRMDNVVGSAVSTNLAIPTPKQLEMASATLPQTGPATSTLIVLLLAAAIVYFYLRNRQLIKEVALLRRDHHGGA